MFSVVITTHNRPQDLIEAVASVARQTEPAGEVIIIDDGSAPAVDIVGLLAAIEGRCPLRLVRHDQAAGAGAARNRGIREARHNWIAFLDDDDQYLPEKLCQVRKFLLTKPSADLVYHAATIQMVKEGVCYETFPQALPATAEAFSKMLEKNFVGGTPMVVAKRDALLTAGGFDESLLAFEDYELWLRMAKAGQELHYLDAVLTRCNYVTRKRSVTKSDGAGMDGFFAIEAKYRESYNALSNSARLEHAIWRHDTITHRAILNLRYADTLRSAVTTWRRFKRPRQLLIAIAACFGPRFLIHLKAWTTPRRAVSSR